MDEISRIGTEHEKFGFEVETLRSINYEQIKKMLYGIAEKFGWDPVMEGHNILGLTKVNSKPYISIYFRLFLFYFILLFLAKTLRFIIKTVF